MNVIHSNCNESLHFLRKLIVRKRTFFKGNNNTNFKIIKIIFGK